MHPVSQDETALATPHPCVRVAPAGLVIPVSLAVGLQVGAVHGYHPAQDNTGFKQPSEQVLEDLPVRFLSEPVPELGEEAVAGSPLPEPAGPGGLPVVFEAEGQPSVAWDSEEVLQQLGLQHGQRVVRLPTRALPVVQASE